MAGAEAGCSSDDECLEELMGGAPSHSRPRSSARQAAKKRPKHEPDSDSDLGTGLERAEQTDLAAALGVKGDMAACEAAADAAAPSKYVAWSKQVRVRAVYATGQLRGAVAVADAAAGGMHPGRVFRGTEEMREGGRDVEREGRYAPLQVPDFNVRV
eukprot:351140-Chlamydomonas_euryale.AAC.19